MSARAHACVALGRCVAFGRPKMSVWGHAGAGSPSSKVACISFLRPLFGTYLVFRLRFFCFRRRRRRLCLPTSTPPVPTLHGGPRLRTGRSRKALAVTLARCRPAPVAHDARLWNGLGAKCRNPVHGCLQCPSRSELQGLRERFEAPQAHVHQGETHWEAAHVFLRRYPPCQALGHRARRRSYGT